MVIRGEREGSLFSQGEGGGCANASLLSRIVTDTLMVLAVELGFSRILTRLYMISSSLCSTTPLYGCLSESALRSGPGNCVVAANGKYQSFNISRISPTSVGDHYTR